MCESSGRLIAWLDGELEQAETGKIEQHVLECVECQAAINSYRQVSGAFLECYVAAMPVGGRSNGWRWIAVASAAAILLVAFFAWPRPEQLPMVVLPVHAPAIAFEKTPVRIAAVRTHHLPAPQPRRAQWIPPQPSVEVVFPADALFPPGAVPPGFSLIADIRTQP
jgi:hypothetical protein